MKAYLIGNKEPFPITHDLLLILEKILSLDKKSEDLRESLAILMPYAVEIRYPDDWLMPSEKDAVEAREVAGKVLKWLENAMPIIFQKSNDG